MECPICMAEITPQEAESLPCAHTFHRRCISTWRRQSASCPVCRESTSSVTSSTAAAATQHGSVRADQPPQDLHHALLSSLHDDSSIAPRTASTQLAIALGLWPERLSREDLELLHLIMLQSAAASEHSRAAILRGDDEDHADGSPPDREHRHYLYGQEPAAAPRRAAPNGWERQHVQNIELPEGLEPCRGGGGPSLSLDPTRNWDDLRRRCGSGGGGSGDGCAIS